MQNSQPSLTHRLRLSSREIAAATVLTLTAIAFLIVAGVSSVPEHAGKQSPLGTQNTATNPVQPASGT